MKIVQTSKLMLTAALCCVLIVCGSKLLADELDNPPLPETTSKTLVGQSSLRVALVDSGVNYLLPEINSRLARSENGKLIGYDFWDMDELPFDSNPTSRGGIQRHGTQTASLLLEEAPYVDLVAYRYPRPDMLRMADLIAHADAHGVRVIGLPLGGNRVEQWEAFEESAQAHPHILFVVSAGNNGRDIDQQPVYPAALRLENMLVVTSADDFGRVADGVNWGRTSVDYMLPAESLTVRRFDGSIGTVSGSSYAVPRAVALAARYLHDSPSLDAMQVLKLVRQHFANGAAPRKVGRGYLYDPRYHEKASISVRETYPYPARKDHARLVDTQLSSDFNENPGAVPADAVATVEELVLPLQILVLDDRWKISEVMHVLEGAEEILGQCSIAFAAGAIEIVESPDYLRDLETGAARTLMDAVRLSGDKRKLTTVFARDTRMSTPYDAEAFGRGNTRRRPWLTDSVWLTLALEDRAIALAHELFHVLVNSGQHSDVDGSLMLARTTGKNTRLTSEECKMARERALELGLLLAR